MINITMINTTMINTTMINSKIVAHTPWDEFRTRFVQNMR